MTSSCSTTLFAASLPMKIVPYIPKACKPKPRPKPKPKPTPGAELMATTKTAEHSSSGVDSEDGGEWFRIDDEFTMPDWNASLPSPYEAVDASHSVGSVDVVGGLGAASESEKLEHYQPSRQSLVGGTDHVTSVAKTNSALNGPFDGSSLDFSLILESDAAEEHHRTTQVKPSNGASDYQGNGYHAAAGAEQYRAGQHSDLNTTSVHALSKEDMDGIRREPSSAEDQLLFDVSRSPLTRKRTRRLSGDTIISSAEVPDITSEPELEDSRLAKRRRPSDRQAESLILDHVPTPKPTPLPTPSSPDCPSGVSNEPSPGPFDNGGQGGGIGSPVPSQNNLEEENGNDGTHAQGIVEGPRHSPRQSSPFEEIEGDQYIDLDLDRREKNRKGSGGEVRERYDDEANQLDEVSCKPSAKTSQRRKRTVPPVRERCRGSSRTAPRRRDWSTMPTRASRQVTSSQSRLSFTPRMDIAIPSCSPQTSSPGTKAGDGSNINYGSSANMSYQITDLTLCAVPNGSSVVIEIIRYRDSKRSPNPAALGHRFLGGEGKVIRMTQLLPDSWMLVGYRYEGGASDPCSRGDLNSDWMSSSHSDAASHETHYSDDDWDEKSEKGEEGTETYGQRMRKPWLQSDEVRLLSYKDKMGMKWKDILKRFPDRSAGAVKLRYYTLRKKDS